MMKIVTIIGARPQFVKAAAVSRAIQKDAGINEVIIHTGQHFDKNMSEIFFQEMEIPRPNYNLNINCLGHGAMTGQMLEKIEAILLTEKPDWVLVYGDTNSTLAGALAAIKLHIKVAHVEAGLRSFNMLMPEEINRILTDRISKVLFCPTDIAVSNLNNEGFQTMPLEIVQCGDVMLDAAMYYSNFSDKKAKVIRGFNLNQFVLCTIHRADNTDDINRLSQIIRALNEIELPVVVPLHPRTRKIITQNSLVCDFKIIDPVGYFDMIELIKASSLIMTDSGGLQKEAFFFKKHCVTLRDETEWRELVDGGFNVVVGSDFQKIINGFSEMLNKKSDFSIPLYGDGQASNVIIKKLIELLC